MRGPQIQFYWRRQRNMCRAVVAQARGRPMVAMTIELAQELWLLMDDEGIEAIEEELTTALAEVVAALGSDTGVDVAADGQVRTIKGRRRGAVQERRASPREEPA